MDYFTKDGEKSWRQRTEEFQNDLNGREELLSKWSEVWKCFLNALENLQKTHLSRIVYILNEAHSVSGTIQRQMSHYLYHIGQMVFIGKLIKGDEWKPLSIPKSQSSQHNTQQLYTEKEKRHFTDSKQIDRK